jgi:Tfp pilus assembly protein PilF
VRPSARRPSAARPSDRYPENYAPRLFLALIYGELHRIEDARAEVQALLQIEPQYSLKRISLLFLYKDQALVDRAVEILRDARSPGVTRHSGRHRAMVGAANAH